MMVCRPVGVLALTLVAASGPGDSDLTPHLRALLADDLKFPASELTDLERGNVVTRSLDATAPGELAVVGAVRIKARKETFVDAYRDIVHFKRGPGVLQIGRFSDPPVMADLNALTVDRQDADFRDCRVRNCDIRLPAEAIARIQHEVDWNTRDADARAAALFKEILLGHVRAYATGAPGRITEYDDEQPTIRPADEFAGPLRQSAFIGRLVPGLDEHLRDFPLRPLAGAEDFLYWSKEKFGMAPFITVTHVTIARDAAGDYVMTSKDVYSSRYIDASLTVAVAGGAAGTPAAFYMVYANRSRASALKGSFGVLRRAIAGRRARSSIDENLKSLRLRLEKD
jgi:hypothetical protein